MTLSTSKEVEAGIEVDIVSSPSSLSSHDFERDSAVSEIKQDETNPVNQTKTQHRQMTGLSWVLLVTSLLSAVFLYALDNTVLANVRPSIIETLGHIDLLPCVSVFYTLAIAAFAPLWGQLNGEADRKVLFLSALILFMAGSAINGSARSMQMLICGRFIGGIGGSGLFVGVPNILSTMTAPAERAQYLNFIAMAWGTGTMLGPIIGGAIADSKATWRWAFYLNLCIAAASFPICLILIPSASSIKSHASRWQLLKSVDYVGAALYCGGAVSVVLTLSFGGSVYAWNSTQMIVLYLASGATWPLFVIQQRFKILTKNRLFPIEYAVEWRMVTLFCWTSLVMGSLLVPVYTLPLLFQFAFGSSSLTAAKFTLPFLASGIVTLAVGGRVFRKIPIYALWFMVGGTLMLVGSALLSTVTIHSRIGTVCGFSIICGVGTGLVVQLAFVVAQLKKPMAEQGRVTTFMTCAQITGSVFAISISTCIFMNHTTSDLSVVLPAFTPTQIQAAISGAGYDLLSSIPPNVRQQVLTVIAKNAASLFYLNVAGSALGLVLALNMPWERLTFRSAK